MWCIPKFTHATRSCWLMSSPSKYLWKSTIGSPGRLKFHMLLEDSSASFLFDTAKLYRAQLAFFRRRLDPTTVCEQQVSFHCPRVGCTLRRRSAQEPLVSDTHVPDRGITRVNGITTGNSPTVVLCPIHDGVHALNVRWEVDQGIVLVRYVITGNLLLDCCLTPVIFEPRQFNLFLSGGRVQQRVL